MSIIPPTPGTPLTDLIQEQIDDRRAIERQLRNARALNIPPPTPAPYLKGITALPNLILKQIDGRRSLERQQERTFEFSVRAIARHIRRARKEYEKEHGVIIEPEPPRLPANELED